MTKVQNSLLAEMREFSLTEAHDADKTRWYLHFLAYCDAYYMDINHNVPKLRWHVREEEWYLYNDEFGVYQQISAEDVEGMFYEWADYIGMVATSTTKTNHALRRLKTKYRMYEVWDQGVFSHKEKVYSTVENIYSGLLDINTKTLIPHSPLYLSKTQIPRHYLADVTTAHANLTKLYSGTPRWERLHKFMVMVVHRRFDDEIFLMLYGKKGSGKSTFLQILEHLFGRGAVSKTVLQKFGKRFGLKELYDKRVNVNPDLPKTKLNAETVAILKQLTGKDGEIEVEKKGVDAFKWPTHCFLAKGANQLMGFTQDATSEIESIMRRVCLIHYPETLPRDPAFKDAILDPLFLDHVYSYYVNCEYEPMFAPEDLDEWIQQNLAEWLLDADPIMKYLKESYEYAPDQTDTSPDGDPVYEEMPCSEVRERIEEMLLEDGHLVPKDLQADITQALQSMKILKNERRGKSSRYLKIKIKGAVKKTTETQTNLPTQPDPTPMPHVAAPVGTLVKIIKTLQEEDPSAVFYDDLVDACKLEGIIKKVFLAALDKAVDEGKVVQPTDGWYTLPAKD